MEEQTSVGLSFPSVKNNKLLKCGGRRGGVI